MAWTEQCKLAYRANAEKLIERGMSRRATFRHLSGESGIAYGTLRNWYYENEPVELPNNEESVPEIRNTQSNEPNFAKYIYFCPHCGEEVTPNRLKRRKKDGIQ